MRPLSKSEHPEVPFYQLALDKMVESQNKRFEERMEHYRTYDPKVFPYIFSVKKQVLLIDDNIIYLEFLDILGIEYKFTIPTPVPANFNPLKKEFTVDEFVELYKTKIVEYA